jgi:hypothetical protein
MKPDGKINLPNPTQKRVLSWVDNIRSQSNDSKDHIPVLLLMGGVGSGKTRGILAPCLEMLIEISNLRMFWGRQDFNDIKLSVMDKFFEILPIELLVKKNEQYHWYDINTGRNKQPSRIYFNGLKDLSGLGSQEFGVIVVTEAHEISEQAYRTLKRRCRQEGMPNMILMEGEPPNEGHWLTRLTNPSLEEYDPDIEKWELSTYENWDNLPAAYRGSLERMPEAWKRKYLMGKPGFIPKGRPFYEGFKEVIHTTNLEWNPYEDLILSWDMGYHHPAVSFHQINDRWYILRELMGSEVTIRNFCKQVKAFLNMNFPNARIKCYGDPACKQVNDKSEQTSWHICKEEGFIINCAPNSAMTGYRARKEIIDQKLSTMVNGKPSLIIDPRCKTIVEGFLGGYHYAESNSDKEINTKYESPFHDDFYSHLMNTVEYVGVNVFRPIERHTDKSKYAYRRESSSNAGFSFH